VARGLSGPALPAVKLPLMLLKVKSSSEAE
jgi:hypothetical protein